MEQRGQAGNVEQSEALGTYWVLYMSTGRRSIHVYIYEGYTERAIHVDGAEVSELVRLDEHGADL